MDIDFIVERMFFISQGGNLKAFADVAIGEICVIKGVRILENKKKLFISMPQEQGKNNKWYDHIIFKSEKAFSKRCRMSS